VASLDGAPSASSIMVERASASEPARQDTSTRSRDTLQVLYRLIEHEVHERIVAFQDAAH